MIADAGVQAAEKKRRGRKDNDGQEAVIRHKELLDRVDELVRLHGAAKDSATDFGEAVKACAEKSGYNAAAVRKFISARAGEDFDGEQRKVEQLALIFDV